MESERGAQLGLDTAFAAEMLKRLLGDIILKAVRGQLDGYSSETSWVAVLEWARVQLWGDAEQGWDGGCLGSYSETIENIKGSK